MIKVRLQDDEVIEVSGDEKEVSKFIKKYMDYMDEEFLFPSDDYDCDDDEDDCGCNHFKCSQEDSPYLSKANEMLVGLKKMTEKFEDPFKENIIKILDGNKKGSTTQKDEGRDDLGYYSKYVDSSDYKERFIAEYHQLRIRVNKLKDMLDKWDQGKLDFTPKTPKTIFVSQYSHMVEYLEILKVRAGIEDIDV